MKTSRRDVLRYMAIGTAAVTLAACAPKAEPAAEKPAEKAAVPATAAPAAPVKAGDKITLNQWYHEYGEKGCQEAVYRIAEEYSNSQDKVKVEVGWFPGDYVPKVNASLAAGDAPDCFEHHLDMDYVRTGAVLALDDLLDAETKADFLEGVMSKLCSIKSHVYALPVVVDFQGLYFNKKLLEEKGLNTDPEKWDWNLVFEAGEKLTEGRRKGLFLGNGGGQDCMRDYGVKNAGISMINPETFELDFSVESTYQVFEQFREYQKKNTLLQGAPTDWWDPSAINQGLTAIQWGGFWQMPGTAAVLGEDGFTFCVFPPHPAGAAKARYYTEMGGWVGSVYGKTKYKDEALAYTKWQWIDNKDWQNEWSTAYGFHIPARKSAAAANAKLQTGNGAVAVKQVNSYGQVTHKLWGGAVATPWNDAVTEIFKNNANAKEQVDKAFELCKKELETQKKFWDELPG
jgi:multiple sugar transport system substrate-binding protein